MQTTARSDLLVAGLDVLNVLEVLLKRQLAAEFELPGRVVVYDCQHARARHVSVILERRDHYAVAIVEDDGIGFDTEEMMIGKVSGRLGLLGMRERVALVGGTLEVESTLGAGTTVFVRIPLPA